MNKFASKAKESTGSNPVMLNREQVTVEDVIGKCGDITITEFSIMIDKEGREYCVVSFAEDPHAFMFGGAVLTSICKNWVAMYDGDIDMANHDLNECGGCKVHLSYTKNKKGQRMVNVEVID